MMITLVPVRGETRRRLNNDTCPTAAPLWSLRCADAERTPGPSLRCLQWHRSGLNDAKRRWLARLLDESSIQVCARQEVRFTTAGLRRHLGTRAFSIPVRQAKRGTALASRCSRYTTYGQM